MKLLTEIIKTIEDAIKAEVIRFTPIYDLQGEYQLIPLTNSPGANTIELDLTKATIFIDIGWEIDKKQTHIDVYLPGLDKDDINNIIQFMNNNSKLVAGSKIPLI